MCETNITRIASFDPGRKNFSFCVEQFDTEQIISLKSKIPKEKYSPDGTPTTKMQEVLNNIYKNGHIILHKNIDISGKTTLKAGAKIEQEIFNNMIGVLDKHKEIWDTCDKFIIEEQMAFGKKLNIQAVKLAQNIYTYFVMRYSMFKTVIEFHSYHKTQVLGAPKIEGKKTKKGKTRFKAMEKPQRKKWSIEKAKEILILRGDVENLENLKSSRKKDDLADVICQLQAAKYLLYCDQS